MRQLNFLMVQKKVVSFFIQKAQLAAQNPKSI